MTSDWNRRVLLVFLAYKTVLYSICTTGQQLADFLCKGGKGPAADVIEKNLVLKAIRRLFANKKLLQYSLWLHQENGVLFKYEILQLT